MQILDHCVLSDLFPHGIMVELQYVAFHGIGRKFFISFALYVGAGKCLLPTNSTQTDNYGSALAVLAQPWQLWHSPGSCNSALAVLAQPPLYTLRFPWQFWHSHFCIHCILETSAIDALPLHVSDHRASKGFLQLACILEYCHTLVSTK